MAHDLESAEVMQSHDKIIRPVLVRLLKKTKCSSLPEPSTNALQLGGQVMAVLPTSFDKKSKIYPSKCIGLMGIVSRKIQKFSYKIQDYGSTVMGKKDILLDFIKSYISVMKSPRVVADRPPLSGKLNLHTTFISSCPSDQSNRILSDSCVCDGNVGGGGE